MYSPLTLTSPMALVCVMLLLASVSLSSPVSRRSQDHRRPITLDSSGGFNVGGKIISNPRFPNLTLSCDHGYMEYFIPYTPRKTSIVMWHSSSTQTFQNRWDGGPGFKDMFLRRDYPVYLWDGPRVGRANWGCEPSTYTPDYRDQGNFAAWNLGPYYKNWWPDVQFPVEDDEAWLQATRSRYVEYDSDANVQLHSDAAAVGADSGKLGKDIVYLTNSASGVRALMTIVKSNSTNIKALVCYEGYGYVYPDNVNVTGATSLFGSGYGPYVVPLEDFKKLARLEAVMFYWSDHRDESFTFLKQSRQVAALINLYGGNAKVVKLGDDLGLKGSTHVAFADMDNDKVADHLENFLEENGLADYAKGPDERRGSR
ncbi:hypothetical protein KJ359_012109 [Pestalotiopsis sp. 9143b]|nr:hypothetical protein KJ359_012109 [Pestalotiopsis sp. 9143b]